MSTIVKDFNYSRKLCNVVDTVLQISCLFAQRQYKSSRQDLDKLVTNIPQLIECGDFCQIRYTPIKCIFEELLSVGSVAFKWEQNV